MSQQHHHPLQHLMQDLQLRQHKLGEQIVAFQALQNEIIELQENAKQNPQAQKRLERLYHAMENELRPLRERFNECANRLKNSINAAASLHQVSKNKSNSNSPSNATTVKSVPTRGRQFI